MTLWRIGNLKLHALSLSTALMLGVFPAIADGDVVDVSTQSNAHLTVYQNGLALVQEQRPVDLGKNDTTLVINGISPQIVMGSAQVSVPDRQTSALYYDLTPLSLRSMANASIGKMVWVVRQHPTTGETIREEAKILSTSGGIVLQMADRIETGVPGRLVFDNIPDGLGNNPALRLNVAPGKVAKGLMDIKYLSTGITWQANHHLTITDQNEADGTLRMLLSSTAGIHNQTSLNLSSAHIALVAGDVNRESQNGMPQARTMADESMMMMSAAAPKAMAAPQSMQGHYLYDGLGIHQIPAQGYLQIPLNEKVALNGLRTLEIIGGPQPYYGNMRRNGNGQEPQHPGIVYTFENTSNRPLPTGTLRIYASENDAARLLGEDQLLATPPGGTVRLETGKAFDIQVSREQTAFKKEQSNPVVVTSSQKITLFNGGKNDAQVHVIENIPGSWQILETSHPVKQAGMLAKWVVDVPAGQDVEITFTARVKH